MAAGLLALPGCSTVPEPTAAQGLNYGFRTPTQAFESFRTALQGNLLLKEYASLSDRLRRELGASSPSSYDLGREELTRRFPRLRWFIHRAEAPEVIAQTEDRAVLQSRVPGTIWSRDSYIVTTLARESFVEFYGAEDPELVHESFLVDDLWEREILGYSEARDQLEVVVDEFSDNAYDLDPSELTEFRVGVRWKLDAIEILGEPIEPQPAVQ